MTEDRLTGASPRPARRDGPPDRLSGVRPEYALGAILAITMLLLGGVIWLSFAGGQPPGSETTTQIRSASQR